jgi:hypothetical protein
MYIGAQSYVAGEVPSDVVGVVINHDVVTVPQPVIAKGKVECGHREEESTFDRITGLCRVNFSEDRTMTGAAGRVAALTAILMSFGSVGFFPLHDETLA